MIKQDYKNRDRRRMPTKEMANFIDRTNRLAKLTTVLFILCLAILLVAQHGHAQWTPQDGYDSLNMAPQGLYWQNRAQSYGEPAAGRYGAPSSSWSGFEPSRAPTYYNEHGQETTVPDERQYYDVQGVDM